jgi:hypothetical protein
LANQSDTPLHIIRMAMLASRTSAMAKSPALTPAASSARTLFSQRSRFGIAR